MATPYVLLRKLISALKNHEWRWHDTCKTEIEKKKTEIENCKEEHRKGPITRKEMCEGKK